MDVSKTLPMLVLTLALAGCMTTTGTDAIEAPPPAPDPVVIEQGIVDRVCTVWLPIEWSTKAPDWMIDQVKGSNRARIGFGCTDPAAPVK